MTTKQNVIDFIKADKNFQFDIFNAMTEQIAAGLKIALAEGLLRDSLYSLEKFHNPLAEDCQAVLGDVKTFRVKYKAAADQRKKASTSADAAGITS